MNKDFNKYLDGYKNKSEDEKLIVLDRITPLVQIYMNSLTSMEQAIMHYLIIPDKASLTNKNMPEKLTNSFLSKKLREESKAVAVYLGKLVEKGYITRTPINNKDYSYAVEDRLVVDWFRMRNRH